MIQSMEPTVETEPQLTLTAQDRCDRCGAQAYHQAEIAPDLILLFCNHHLQAHLTALVEQKVKVRSDSAEL